MNSSFHRAHASDPFDPIILNVPLFDMCLQLYIRVYRNRGVSYGVFIDDDYSYNIIYNAYIKVYTLRNVPNI